MKKRKNGTRSLFHQDVSLLFFSFLPFTTIVKQNIWRALLQVGRFLPLSRLCFLSFPAFHYVSKTFYSLTTSSSNVVQTVRKAREVNPVNIYKQGWKSIHKKYRGFLAIKFLESACFCHAS